MGCLFRCKRKSPSPLPVKTPSPVGARNVIPGNVWKKIARNLDPQTRASLARTLPGIISRNRRVIVRSRATAKPVKVGAEGLFKLTPLNRTNPVAYKNTQWKYYIPYNKYHAYFSNTVNGPLFMINTKTGARKPVPERLAIFANTPRTARKTQNNWNSYLKRAEAGRRYAAGANKRDNKFFNLNRKVSMYLNKKGSLNNVKLPDLVFWAQQSNMMSGNGRPYQKRGGLWYHYGGGTPVTKRNIIENIRLAHNARRNNEINNNAFNPLRNRGYN
jgi:hypothetical protein